MSACVCWKTVRVLVLAYLETHEVDAAIIDYHLTDGTCAPVLCLLIARHIPFVIVSGDTFGANDIPPGALLHCHS
jgi:hypothetical protein